MEQIIIEARVAGKETRQVGTMPAGGPSANRDENNENNACRPPTDNYENP